MAMSLDERRSRSIGRLNARISARISRELTAHGVDLPEISLAQKALLINLEERGNRARTLADRLHISKQAVSQLVQELELKGLIRRQADPTDGRAFLIVFTKKGKRIVTDTLACFADVEALIARELGQGELEALRDKLTALAELLDPDGF